MRYVKRHLIILLFFFAATNVLFCDEIDEIGSFEEWGCDWDYDCENSYCYTPLKRHQIYVGPEIYHACRTREGGIRQNGTLYGIRVGYDHLKRCRFYWGLDALYATGCLSGKSGLGNSLKSDFTDASVEGRFGYTFQKKECRQFSFTPYIGGGYFWEKNHYKNPSPIHVHFDTEYWYVSGGFLANYPINARFEIGLNFKVKYPFDPQCKVTHDPLQDNFTQNIEQKPHYRVELPLIYNFECYQHWGLCLSPFFEYREYGSHPNFPINYLNTKFRNYGATLELLYRL